MSDEIHELYTNTHIGIALQDTLNQLCETGEINTEFKNDFLDVFQKKIIDIIKEDSQKVCSISGYLETYQNLDNDWKFWIKNAVIRNETTIINVPMLKIVSVSEDHKNAEMKAQNPIKRRKIKEENNY